MPYTIDKNVPLPTDITNGGDKYNWEDMEVGDSLFIPGVEAPNGDLEKLRLRVYGAARKWGTPKGHQFVARVVEEERERSADSEAESTTYKVKGVRCWRLPDKPTEAVPASPQKADASAGPSLILTRPNQ